jgi:hypothetical protein
MPQPDGDVQLKFYQSDHEIYYPDNAYRIKSIRFGHVRLTTPEDDAAFSLARKLWSKLSLNGDDMTAVQVKTYMHADLNNLRDIKSSLQKGNHDPEHTVLIAGTLFTEPRGTYQVIGIGHADMLFERLNHAPAPTCHVAALLHKSLRHT